MGDPVTADELIAKLREVPPYTPVDIFQIEACPWPGELRAKYGDGSVTLTNDATFPGETL